MKKIAAPLIMSIFVMSSAQAIVLFRTDDPTANITAPTNDFAGSGWNYEGQFGGFLGTPIARHFFITATHIGQAGAALTFQGTNYPLFKRFDDPATDLTIWQITGILPFFAPLYTAENEIGQRVVVIGRGAPRGTGIFVDANLRGWNWGPGDNVQRWGENIVSSIALVDVPGGIEEAVYAKFDQNGLPNECHFSGGDSGGAIFLNDQGVWKLAGINYAVDGSFYTDSAGNGAFVAALFDMRDFWVENDTPPPTYIQITGLNPVPSGFYSTRISSRVAWIYSVIDPTGDLDKDKIPNLLEYALNLDPLQPDAAGLPQVGREGNFITLTYTKVLNASDITYAIEQSADLISWATANPQNEIVSTTGNIQTIKAKIDIGTALRFFVRLRITRP